MVNLPLKCEAAQPQVMLNLTLKSPSPLCKFNLRVRAGGLGHKPYLPAIDCYQDTTSEGSQGSVHETNLGVYSPPCEAPPGSTGS